MHIVIKGHLDKNVPSDSEKIKIKWDENVANIFIPFDFWGIGCPVHIKVEVWQWNLSGTVWFWIFVMKVYKCKYKYKYWFLCAREGVMLEFSRESVHICIYVYIQICLMCQVRIVWWLSWVGKVHKYKYKYKYKYGLYCVRWEWCDGGLE